MQVSLLEYSFTTDRFLYYFINCLCSQGMHMDSGLLRWIKYNKVCTSSEMY